MFTDDTETLSVKFKYLLEYLNEFVLFKHIFVRIFCLFNYQFNCCRKNNENVLFRSTKTLPLSLCQGLEQLKEIELNFALTFPEVV